MKVALLCCPVWSHSSPPLSLAVLQARLKKAGYKVVPIDFSVDFYNEHKVWYKYLQFLSYICRQELLSLFYYLFLIPKRHYSKQIKKILSMGADVICFTIYKSNVLTSLYFAAKIKEIKPGVKIIFGGPACYFKNTRNFILKSKSVDYIVAAEGDLLLLEILKNIKDKNYKIKNRLLNDRNQEPLPDFSGFELDKYALKRLPYFTTRGCYNRCSFCSDVIFWQKYRYKSANKIFRDLKKLRDLYGVNTFLFSDSLTIGNHKNIEKFCDLIIKNKLKIKWGGQARCKSLDKKILKKMKDAGCTCLSFGVESGSQRILELMKKDYHIDEIQKVIRTASKIGINVDTDFMVGYPTETRSDFYKTIKFVRDNRKYISRAFCSPTSIFEGTELYHKAEKFGIRRKESFFWFSKGNNFLIRFIRLIILNFIDKVSK